MRKTILLLLICLLAGMVFIVVPGSARSGPLQTAPTDTQPPYPVPEPTKAPTVIPAPTEPPAHTPTGAPGFYVSRIEPSRISPLTGGTISIYGGGFVDGTAVRLV